MSESIKRLFNAWVWCFVIVLCIMSKTMITSYAASGIDQANEKLPSNQFAPLGDGSGDCNIGNDYTVAGTTTTKKEGNKITITTDLYAKSPYGIHQGYAAARILVLCFDDNDLQNYDQLYWGKYYKLNFNNNKFATYIDHTRIKNGGSSYHESNRLTYVNNYNKNNGLTGDDAFRITATTEWSNSQITLDCKTTFTIYNVSGKQTAQK